MKTLFTNIGVIFFQLSSDRHSCRTLISCQPFSTVTFTVSTFYAPLTNQDYIGVRHFQNYYNYVVKLGC